MRKFDNREYFENRVKNGFGFHYKDYYQNLYATETRLNALRNYWYAFNDKTVLDIGCGDGSWLDIFDKMGALVTAGVEQPGLLTENAKKSGHTILEYDITKKNENVKADYFDTVVMITSFNFVDPSKRKDMLDNIKRLMKKFGNLLIVDYFPEKVPEYQYKMEYKHVWSFSEVKRFMDQEGMICFAEPVNFVDSFFFHYFGANWFTYHLTKFFDLLLSIMPTEKAKYKLLICRKI